MGTLAAIEGFPWDTLAKNLAADSGGFFILVPAIAYLLGIGFLIAAIKQAANAGNPQSRHDHGKHAWAWSLGLASVLFAFPSTMQGLMLSLYGGEDTTNAMEIMHKVQGKGKMAPLVPIFAVFGLIAVIRGLIQLRAVAIYGNHSKGGASFARSVVLIVSGVMLVNLKKTFGMLSAMEGRPVGEDWFNGEPDTRVPVPVGVTIGKMAGHIAESLGGVAIAFEAFLYLMAISFIVAALLAAWKYKKTDGRDGNMTFLVTCVILAVCSMAAPTVLDSGIKSIFKDSAVVKVEAPPVALPVTPHPTNLGDYRESPNRPSPSPPMRELTKN